MNLKKAEAQEVREVPLQQVPVMETMEHVADLHAELEQQQELEEGVAIWGDDFWQH